MLIEATQRKLQEAQFFLGHLAAEQAKEIRNQPEAFGFYLSALLSAGRSVTFALQHEVKKEYDAWFPVWLSTRNSEEQGLLELFKNQRNFEQKRGGAETSFVWEDVPITKFKANRSHPSHQTQWFGPPGTPEPTVGVPVYSFKSEQREQEVMATCRQYVAVLVALVQDFIQAHS